ncbi:uncharacterized protein [Chironomus tepperi]|uniref:uncharacterized protein n=1 Tax=Chironomus tepperi TaxID=113505 RepID=UPI00391F88E2
MNDPKLTEPKISELNEEEQIDKIRETKNNNIIDASAKLNEIREKYLRNHPEDRITQKKTPQNGAESAINNHLNSPGRSAQIQGSSNPGRNAPIQGTNNPGGSANYGLNYNSNRTKQVKK